MGININMRRPDKLGRRRYLLVEYDEDTKSRLVDSLELWDDPRETKAARKEVRRKVEELLLHRRDSRLRLRHGLPVPTRQNANFVAFVDELIVRRYSHDRSWRSMRKHLHDFTGGKDTKGGKLPFRALDERWLESFKDHLLRCVRQSTARTYFEKLRTALRQAKRERLIAENPATEVRNFPKAKPTPEERKGPKKRALDRKELLCLALYCFKDMEVLRCFLFCCYTGLRISDAMALRWFEIIENEHGPKLDTDQLKTGNDVASQLGDEAFAILMIVPRGQPDALVFNLPCTQTVRRHLIAAGKAAGLWKHVTPHAARRTAATLAARPNIRRAQKLLGHSTAAQTYEYIDIEDVDLLPWTPTIFGDRLGDVINNLRMNYKEGQDAND